MPDLVRGQLAPAGTTGNNTHASASFDPRAKSVVVEFEIEAVGAGPTVTLKVQASLDDQGVPDASSDWFDLSLIPFTTTTGQPVATDTKTAVGSYAYNLQSMELAKKVRLVTSANTNVTYNAKLSHFAG